MLTDLAQYCCPKATPLNDCTWRGSAPDCADAKCKQDEVAIDNNVSGGGGNGCSCKFTPLETCNSSNIQ